MSGDFLENHSGIQDERDSSSSLMDYRDEIKALAAGSIIATGAALPTELSEDVYGPSDLYEDSVETATHVYLESSDWIHEGAEVSFEVINSIL